MPTVGWLVGWLVGWCRLTSHSALFQLYSDGTVVPFPIFDLLPGTQRHGQLGVLSLPSLPRHGHRDVQMRLLPPCHKRDTRKATYSQHHCGAEVIPCVSLYHTPGLQCTRHPSSPKPPGSGTNYQEEQWRPRPWIALRPSCPVPPSITFYH